VNSLEPFDDCQEFLFEIERKVELIGKVESEFGDGYLVESILVLFHYTEKLTMDRIFGFVKETESEIL